MKTLALLLPAALLMLLMYKTDAKMEIITNTQDIRVGTEILLLCKAGGEGEITWQKDGEDIDDENVKKMDETSSKLTITQATMKDAGVYSCHCEFDNGHADQIMTQLYIFDGPSFGQTKNYHEFLEGTVGMVPCLVTGQPAVDVIWLRDTKPISSKAGGRLQQMPDNSLLIEKVRIEDAGTYTCQGQIRGRGIYSNLSVSVVVNVSPKVQLKEGEKKVLAGPETNVSLLCSVEGIPEPNITWTIPTTSDSSRHQFNSNRSQLIINSVTRSDYGEYVCTATNKIGESSGVIMLHVFEAPEVFVSTEQQSVSVGERVSVSCNVSGHPNPDQGASPLQNFYLRYRKDEDDAKWKEMQLLPTSDSISLQDLAFGSRYEVEVTTVNANGSSVLGTFNFTIC